MFKADRETKYIEKGRLGRGGDSNGRVKSVECHTIYEQFFCAEKRGNANNMQKKQDK
jgi:hypothetical protein